jgi:hypothetical protein
MPARISQEEAQKSMAAAGLKPLVGYVNFDTPWECECLKCGELVSPTLHSIRSGQGGCGYCAGRKVNPRKVIEFMNSQGFEPLEDYPGNKAKWKCLHIPCGSIVYAQYNKVQQGSTNSGCSECSEKYVDPIKAEARMIAAGGVPQEPYPGSQKKWKCKCLQCGEIVDALYSTVRDGGGVCQLCALKKTAKGRRHSMEKVLEDYARVNLVPIEDYTTTGAPLKSKCLVCGNFPAPTYTAIRAGVGCRYCSEKLTSPEKARKLALEAGLEPLEDFVSGQVPWRCKHIKCGQTVSPLFLTILKGNSGCIKCNSKDAAERYRFSEEKATAIMLKAGMQPLEPYVNALNNWKCKCLKCGNVITPKLNSVQNGSGCIHCSDFGFNLSEEAYIYLMFHQELNGFKIGIGGKTTRSDRIKTHIRYGWELFNRKEYSTGLQALEVEQELLTWLRVDLGMGVYLLAEQMPQGGHTETVDASEIDLPTIWAKVEVLSKVKE